MNVTPDWQGYQDILPLHFSKIVDKYDPQASVSLFPDKLSISKRANSTGHSHICMNTKSTIIVCVHDTQLFTKSKVKIMLQNTKCSNAVSYMANAYYMSHIRKATCHHYPPNCIVKFTNFNVFISYSNLDFCLNSAS